MLNEYECSRCGVICRGHAAPWRCSECGSERVERRARPNWMQRAAKPVSVPGEGTKTEVEEGADAASVGGRVCPRCHAPMADDARKCEACGHVPASALSDAELMASLRAYVRSPRPTATDLERDAERFAARRFAESRGGLIDRERPAAAPRRGVWLNGVMGPTFVPLPTPGENAQRDDRPGVLREFDRVERAMASYRAW
jgi:hypothetical protein